MMLPVESIGPVMQLCTDRRGVYVRTEYLSPTRAMLTFNLPLADVIYDMHDKLKSVTRGYGTMDYEFVGYRPADLVRLDVLVHHRKERVILDAFDDLAVGHCREPAFAVAHRVEREIAVGRVADRERLGDRVGLDRPDRVGVTQPGRRDRTDQVAEGVRLDVRVRERGPRGGGNTGRGGIS